MSNIINTKYSLRSTKRRKIEYSHINPYHNELNIKPSQIIKNVRKIVESKELEYIYGKFNYHIDIMKRYIDRDMFDLIIMNDSTVIEIADYLDYHTWESDSKNYIQKLITNAGFSNIIIIWFLTYDSDHIPIVMSTFNNYNYQTKTYLSKHEYLIPIADYKINNQWVSASKTRNCMLDDPIIDYLDYNKIYEPDDLNLNIPDRKRKYSSIDTTDEFLKILFANGIEFEKRIVDKLKEDLSKDIITILDTTDRTKLFKNTTDPVYAYITKYMMTQGYGIIYQGVLHDPETQTYGLPDLMIRSDFINKIFDEEIETDERILESTGQLPYYIVDIKNSTMHLSAKNDNVLNYVNTKPFKGQIAIYHQILSKMQNYDTSKGFILASKWTRKQRDITYQSTNPFDRLGIIDFSNNDSLYLKSSIDAIKWIQLVKDPFNNLNCLEPNHLNLYPNMCNQTDGKFKKVKKHLAKRNYEITNLWMCGPKHRSNAFKSNIKKWSDPKLNSNILGLTGKTASTVDLMLNLNRSDNLNIYPDKIKSRLYDWTDRNKLAFYVDFETINPNIFNLLNPADIYDLEIDSSNYNDLIFMIGVGYSVNNEWKFESFIAKDLSDQSQITIINQMIDLIKNIAKENNINYEDCNIYHWSSFEQIILNKLTSKYNITHPKFKWADILKIFHEEPIIIKGALNFSIKTIGKAMFDLGMIQTYWNSDSSCSNGLDAMYQSYQIYSKREKSNINTDNCSIEDDPQMITIAEYNMIDCKIMWDILNGLMPFI